MTIKINYIKRKYDNVQDIINLIDNISTVKDFVYMLIVLGYEKNIMRDKLNYSYLNNKIIEFSNYIVIGQYKIAWSKISVNLMNSLSLSYLHFNELEKDNVKLYIIRDNSLVALSDYNLDSRTIDYLHTVFGYCSYNKKEKKKLEKIIEKAVSINKKIKADETKKIISIQSRRPAKKFSFDPDDPGYYNISRSDSIVKSIGMNDIEDSYQESLVSNSWD